MAILITRVNYPTPAAGAAAIADVQALCDQFGLDQPDHAAFTARFGADAVAVREAQVAAEVDAILFGFGEAVEVAIDIPEPLHVTADRIRTMQPDASTPFSAPWSIETAPRSGYTPTQAAHHAQIEARWPGRETASEQFARRAANPSLLARFTNWFAPTDRLF